jgi:hypothetical protein
LRAKLDWIERGGEVRREYWPCEIELSSGQVITCACVTSVDSWRHSTQYAPGGFASVEQIRDIRESPTRLPRRFAQSVYDAGESGMGYTIYAVVYRDNARSYHGGGNLDCFDFVSYPEGQSARTVSGVLPHQGRMERKISNPLVVWCVFSD